VKQFVMLLGGPGDGRVIEFDTNSDQLVWPVEHERVFDKDPEDPIRLDYTIYRYQKLATPDRWVQVVYVHQDVDLDSVPESNMIRAIMTPWREKHRKAAESGRIRLPSGFTLTKEML
jgi:hypothetical protein